MQYKQIKILLSEDVFFSEIGKNASTSISHPIPYRIHLIHSMAYNLEGVENNLFLVFDVAVGLGSASLSAK